MKSYKYIQKEATLKKLKKENAPDIISKSFKKNNKANYLKGSGGIISNL